MAPAIASSVNGRIVAVAASDLARARALAESFGARSCGYDDLLADPDVDAVYISLVNSLHREWTERALRAGKHVLCEKPLATGAVEGEAMVAVAEASGRRLMEALMYRFHPRLGAQVESLRGRRVRYVAAWFGFPLVELDNYRLRPELGGGALLDVGSYCLSACRWLLGEPDSVGAAVHKGPTGVDLTTAALLGFHGGATAFAWGSFESPQHQVLEVLLEDEVIRVEQPFTAWRDPDDPYRLMVEAFAAAVIRGDDVPLPLGESLANLRLIDRVREVARLTA